MDKHNDHSKCGHGHMRGSSRKPHCHDTWPYRRAGQQVACAAGPGWLAVKAA